MPTSLDLRDLRGTLSLSSGVIAVAFLLGALVISGPAVHAEPLDSQPETSAARAEASQIIVLFVGVAVDARLRHSIDSLLNSAGVGVRFETRTELSLDEASSEGMRIWLTRPTPTRMRVLLADPEGQRFLVRDVPVERDLDDVDCERIAQVIETAKDALRRPGTKTRQEALAALAVEPQVAKLEPTVEDQARETQASSPIPTQSAEPPRLAPSVRPRVWLGYSAAQPGKGLAVVHGPAAGAAVQLSHPSMQWWLGAEGIRWFEQRVVNPEVELRLQGTSLRVVTGAGWWVGEHLTVGVQGGIGVELARVVPERGTGAAAEVEPGTTHTTPWAGVGVPFALLWGGLGIFAEPRLDVGLAKTHYDLERSGERSAVLSLSPLRPSAQVGIVWSPVCEKSPSRASTSQGRGTVRVR